MSDKEDEKMEDENTEDQEDESNEEASDSLEDLKDEVADAYLNLLDVKKGGNIAAAASLGISLNPLRQGAIDYMLADDKMEEKDFFGKLGKKIKKEILKKIPGGELLDYNKSDLKKMKELIKQNKDNTTALENIKAQIEQGIDPTITNVDNKTNSKTADASTNESKNPKIIVKPNEKFSSESTDLFKLVAGGVLTSEIIKYTNETVKSIDPEINGDFVNIKEIKDKDGKIILECLGETPYVNKTIITDLLGFASAFYKITGNALTLTSGYRTLEHQKRLDEEMPDIAAAPGKSGHNLGFSIDIEGTDKKIKTLGGIKGFRELAEKFNFNPIDSEDWHFDYKELPEVDNRMEIAQKLDQEFVKNVA